MSASNGIRACVLRTVRGIDQFVPIEDAVIVSGENVFFGSFRSEDASDGPSNSHKLSICLPTGQFGTLPLTCCYLGQVAPDRSWSAVSDKIRNSNNERLFISAREIANLL
jgi:hypothetical protein